MAGHGWVESESIEIQVAAHRRRIRRRRYRRVCGCAGPATVLAAPVARLFPHTAYGISVWTTVLLEHWEGPRPFRQIARWMTRHGLAISPGTRCDRLGDLSQLFEPLSAAIRAHLVTARVLQGDETSWRVQQRRRDGASGRAWLWVGQSHDAVWFHIDPRRSLLKWRYGLERFVADPEVPIDNNASERSLRAPVIGRKLSFGNDSWTGARLTGHMYSVLGTLKRHEIDLEHWLHDWLSACAEAARAPPDLTPLPGSMDPARHQRFQQPRAPPVHG